MDSDFITESVFIYEFTCMPNLKFTNISNDRSIKIKTYIKTKIEEINRLEKKYYDLIMDCLHYEYKYHFKYLISYDEYCVILNTLVQFNKSDKRVLSYPEYWSKNKKNQIKIVHNEITLYLLELKQKRDKKISDIRKFCKKSQININANIIKL